MALLTPFDRVVPAGRRARWRVCSLRRGAAQLAAHVCETAAGGTGTLLQPGLTLVPWQWAAAAALVRGEASVVLLADAVGLGKTIQAALAIAALRTRGDAARVLILTPAGLRDQWQAEIARLFRFPSGVVDAASLRSARRTMPAAVNPWTLPATAIASIDFVKQPEVLAAASGAPWDLLVIDEAHTVGARTDRRVAAAALASCARHVLLLTATPHAGSDEEFAALCAIGAVAGDARQPLFIRRTRSDVGLDSARRVRVARLTLSGPERRMHALLRQYARAVWRERGAQSAAARLAMTVLLKRAASSAWALHCSVGHRIRLLGSEDDLPEQPPLPFDDPGETDTVDADVPDALGEPGLDERGRELKILAALGHAAQLAAASESKLARVATLLRRANEPAVVFTEYRDTLHAATRALAAYGPIAVLHGSLSRADRRDAERVFTGGGARVLLATDVASEGLNLHGRCRLVINLELPWNPVRLEQRIGRVDRIGQQRRVHAVHMVGRETAESYVLERLVARVRKIRRSLGEAYAGVGVTDTMLAAGALGDAAAPHQGEAPEDERPTSPLEGGDHALFTAWAPTEEGERSLCRLLDPARRIDPSQQTRETGARGRQCLPLAIVRPRARARLGLTPGVVFGFRIEALTQTGRAAAAIIMAVHVEIAPLALAATTPRALVAALLPRARAAAVQKRDHRLAQDIKEHKQHSARARKRESALMHLTGGDGDVRPTLVQPGLFDRRALHEAARQQSARDHRRQLHNARLERFARDARVAGVRVEPVVALVLR